jgi:dihydroorotate dehydrogenase electron transfer subunit
MRPDHADNATPGPSERRVAARDALVTANEVLCREHVAIHLELEHFPPSAPGQFVQLQCHAEGADAAVGPREWPAQRFPQLQGIDWLGRAAYLRRPFSIADRWDDDGGRAHLTIISRNVGPGTAWLETLQPGDRLNLTGPLGHGFRIDESTGPAVLIGGGVGIPPLLYLARVLEARGHAEGVAILGVTSADLLPVRLLEQPASDGTPHPCLALPGDAKLPGIVTTDDGTLGLRGRVTDALEQWAASATEPQRAAAVVFACGPEPMLHAVACRTRRLGLACQLCIERNMGCGLGTCLSCVVRRHDAERPAGWSWALTCVDGPVFDRDELLDHDDPRPS